MTSIDATLALSHRRALRLVEHYIGTLNLDLSGLRILTEVGSNSYLYTPAIAALANAQHVCARTADSPYGKGETIRNECMRLAELWGVSHRLEIIVKDDVNHTIPDADIITNSGFLRPLNADILARCKSDAVIPLMYDAWELRDTDIDIEYCKRAGIKVAGTWEDHPSIDVFNSVGALANKLAFEAGLEVWHNRIGIWSDDAFGDRSQQALLGAGAKSAEIYNNADKLATDLPQLDFLYLCDYDECRPYFGSNGIFDLSQITALNPSLAIVHLFGDVDVSLLKTNGIAVYPNHNGHPQQMSYTLAHLGPQPNIALLTASFRVAQEMIEGRCSNLSQPITF